MTEPQAARFLDDLLVVKRVLERAAELRGEDFAEVDASGHPWRVAFHDGETPCFQYLFSFCWLSATGDVIELRDLGGLFYEVRCHAPSGELRWHVAASRLLPSFPWATAELPEPVRPELN